MISGRLLSLNVSPGGVPKLPIESAYLDFNGLDSDGHRGKGHGGPERALCFYSSELIEQLNAEGHSILPGMLGENVTTVGIDLTTIQTGDRFAIGEDAVVEVTHYTTPCKNIVDAFSDGNFNRIAQKQNPGWSRFYARVVVPGVVRRGDPIRLIRRDEVEVQESGGNPAATHA